MLLVEVGEAFVKRQLEDMKVNEAQLKLELDTLSKRREIVALLGGTTLKSNHEISKRGTQCSGRCVKLEKSMSIGSLLQIAKARSESSKI